MAGAAVCGALTAQASTLSPLVPSEGTQLPAPWRVLGLSKTHAHIPITRFEVATVQGERALKVSTMASYGTLVHAMPHTPAGRLQWRWRLDQALAGGRVPADIQTQAGDDAALKVCVMFDHLLDRVPFVERTQLRMARALSGEDLPAATLCYVWDSVYPAGLRGANPYSARVRYIVLQGQGASLSQWQDESRDVAADFVQLFGKELPVGATIPPVRAVLIGADSDNTGGRSVAWISHLTWQP